MSKVTTQNATTDFEYNQNGAVSKMTHPNGNVTKYDYNDLGALVKLSYSSNEAKEGLRLSKDFKYDPAGNIVSVVQSGDCPSASSSISYNYDKINQLVSYTEDGNTVNYVYDGSGNRISETSSGGSEIKYEYNTLNQLVSKTVGDTKYGYDYDARGNLVSEEVNGIATKSYIFDATGRLTEGNNLETGEQSKYSYNALGARIRLGKMIQDITGSLVNKDVDYVTDHTEGLNNDIMMLEKGGNVSSMLYGLGIERLSKTVRPDISNRAEIRDKLFYQADILGSARFASDAKGQLKSHVNFDPWGNLTTPMPEDKDVRFTNHSYDPVIDKYFAQARFYDAKDGRMMSLDPAYADANLYRYCLNNPVNYVDVDGMVPKFIALAGAALASITVTVAVKMAVTLVKKIIWYFSVGVFQNIAIQLFWYGRRWSEIDWEEVIIAGRDNVLISAVGWGLNAGQLSRLKRILGHIGSHSIQNLASLDYLSMPGVTTAIIDGTITGSMSFFDLPSLYSNFQDVAVAIAGFILYGYELEWSQESSCPCPACSAQARNRNTSLNTNVNPAVMLRNTQPLQTPQRRLVRQPQQPSIDSTLDFDGVPNGGSQQPSSPTRPPVQGSRGSGSNFGIGGNGTNNFSRGTSLSRRSAIRMASLSRRSAIRMASLSRRSAIRMASLLRRSAIRMASLSRRDPRRNSRATRPRDILPNWGFGAWNFGSSHRNNRLSSSPIWFDGLNAGSGNRINRLNGSPIWFDILRGNRPSNPPAHPWSNNRPSNPPVPPRNNNRNSRLSGSPSWFA